MLTLKLIQKNQNYSIFHFILFCRYFFSCRLVSGTHTAYDEVCPTHECSKCRTNEAMRIAHCGSLGSGIALAQLRLLFQRTKLNSTNTHRNENLIILISPLTFFLSNGQKSTHTPSHPDTIILFPKMTSFVANVAQAFQTEIVYFN